MIKGIDILNKTEIMRIPALSLILLLMGSISIIVGLGVLTNSYNSIKLEIIATVMVILGFALIVGFFVVDIIPTGRYRYEVTVDDSVSFNDLNKKYDVIEQNGRIWTLKDKEKE